MISNTQLATLTSLWQEQLRRSAANGSLQRAALEALDSPGEAGALALLAENWAQGDFTNLPAVVLLPGEQLPGAAGAYAATTGSIYLSEAWLGASTTAQALAVLNEELGHHLDALLNQEDSSGDEGAIFSRVLAGQPIGQEELDQLRRSDDHGLIRVNGVALEVEFHNGIEHVPANTTIAGTQRVAITAAPLRGDVSLEGLNRYAVELVLDDTTYTTPQGETLQLSAFPGPRASITLELAADKAPVSVENFLGYVRKGFYKDTIFHRVIDGFMIQGGGFDSNTFEQRDTEKPIVLESTRSSNLSNLRGTLAMARTAEPNSASSQFFINTVDNLFLNYNSEQSPGYAVFGAVREGMEVVDAISKAKQRKSILPTDGVYENITEPIVTITAANLLPKPALARFNLIAPAHYGDVQLDSATGSFLYTPFHSSAIDDIFTYSISIPARDGLPARTITRTVDLWADNPTAPAGEEKDLIIGRDSKDTFVIPTLTSSTWAKTDRITNYQSIDTIDAPGLISRTLTKAVGGVKIQSLDDLSIARRSISKLLSRKTFKANQIAAVQLKKGKNNLGTAVAINDAKAGFNPNTDGILVLEQFSLGGGNNINLV
jgi:cyclophilin family peptidyl-prolyl cis-trans isomerase